jgi:Aminoglycoside adenylyltransferase, C-terminal domain
MGDLVGRVATSPEDLLVRLGVGLRAVLGEGLLSLSVHGSWVGGDFKLGRSDLDLLAVLADDPDERTLARLTAMHADMSAQAPEWDNHVEVDYVSVAAVESVLAGEGSEHFMVRISPGEPIHLVHVDRHYLLNWRSAREHDHPIVGRAPTEVLPPIPDDLVREVVIEHARQWPAWLDGARNPEFQAYAVLTMCRALAFLETGRQSSKHAAAVWAQELLPGWRELITWADACWYGSAPEVTPDRTSDVTAFVQSTSRLIVENFG